MRWLHNNDVVGGPRYEMLSDAPMHALRIHPVVADDAGTLTAVASNSLGIASHSARLSVDSGGVSRRREQFDLDQRPVNGVDELRHWDPVSTYSPMSSDNELAVLSAPSKMRPGKVYVDLYSASS